MIKCENDTFSFSFQSAGNYCTFLYRNFIDEDNIFTIASTALSSLDKNNSSVDGKTRIRLCDNYNNSINLINKILSQVTPNSIVFHVNRFLFESIYHTNFFKSTAFSFFNDIIRKIDFFSLYDYIEDAFIKQELYHTKDWIYDSPQFKKSLFYLKFLDIAKTFNLNITDSLLSTQLYKLNNPIIFTTMKGNIKIIENTIKNPQNLLKEQTLLYELLPYLINDFLTSSLNNAHTLCSELIENIFNDNTTNKKELERRQNEKIKEIKSKTKFLTEMKISFSVQPFENNDLKKTEKCQELNKDIPFESFMRFFADIINDDRNKNLNRLCDFLANQIDKMYNCINNQDKRPLLKNIKYEDLSSTFKVGNTFIFPYLLKKNFD